MKPLILISGSQGNKAYDTEGNFQPQSSSGVGKDSFVKFLLGANSDFVHLKLAAGLRDSFYKFLQQHDPNLTDALIAKVKGKKDFEFSTREQLPQKYGVGVPGNHPHINAAMCEYSANMLEFNCFEWVDLFIDKLSLVREDKYVVVSDVRQPHELLTLSTFFPCLTVEVIRNGGSGMRPTQPMDGKIAGLAGLVVDNNGTSSNLKASAENLAQVVGQGVYHGDTDLESRLAHYWNFRKTYTVKIN